MIRAVTILSLAILMLLTLFGCENSTSHPTAKPCEADFTAEPRVGVGITTVHFTDKSTGNVTSWAWDFNGDEVIDSYAQNPTYTYTTNGNFTVTLYITTPNCEAKVTKPGYPSITECHT